MPDDIPLCPPYWPKLVWDLHHRPPIPGPGPGPINYPPAMEDMMAALSIHTLSYLMLEKSDAESIRSAAEQSLARTASQLSALHERES